jgi:WD40 repeat protein
MMIASASQDKTIGLWSLEGDHSLSLLHRLEGHTDGVICVAFNMDNSLLASGSFDTSIRLWDVHSGENRGVLPDNGACVRWMQFHPIEENQLLSCCGDGSITLWDHHAATKIFYVPGAHAEITSNIWFNPAILLAESSKPHVVGMARPQTAEIDVSFVSSSWDGTVKLWKIQTTPESIEGENKSEVAKASVSAELVSTLEDHKHAVLALAFDAEGSRLATGGASKLVFIYSMTKGHATDATSAHIAPGTTSPKAKSTTTNGSVSLSISRGLETMYNTVKSVTHIRNKPSKAQKDGVDNNNSAVAVKPPGPTGYDVLMILRGHTGVVASVQFHATDEHKLLSSSGDKTLLLWDLRTQEQLCSFGGHKNKVTCIRLNPSQQNVTENMRIVSCSEDMTVKVWDAENGRELGCTKCHESYVYNICLSSALAILL